MKLFCDRVPPNILKLEIDWYKKIPIHISEINSCFKENDRIKNTLHIIRSNIKKEDIDSMPKIMNLKFIEDFKRWEATCTQATTVLSSEDPSAIVDMGKLLIKSQEELKKIVCSIFKITENILEDYINYVLDVYTKEYYNIQKYSSLHVILYILHIYLLKRDTTIVNDPYLINIGKYNREERIGEGAYGKIFRVYEQTENSVMYFAEKVQKMLQINEIDILFNHSHPNLLKGIDMFYLKDTYSDLKHHIITQLAVCNLKQAIEKKMYKNAGGIMLKIKWCWDLLNGINYLHSNGIFHGDLKADNILIIQDSETKEYKCVIADFSLSSSIESSLNYCGTPTWTSPEGLSEKYKQSSVNEFNQHLDYRASDMFSVGMIIAYIFSGKKIIKYDKDSNIVSKNYIDYINNWVKKITELKLSSKIEKIVLNLCSPNVSERWTCSQCMKDNIFNNLTGSSLHSGIGGFGSSHTVDVQEYNITVELKKLIKWCIEKLNVLKPHIKVYYITIDVLIRLWNMYNFDQNNYMLICLACILIGGELMRSKEITTKKLLEIGQCSDKLLIGWYRAIPYHLEGKLSCKTFYDLCKTQEEKLWGIKDILEHSVYNPIHRYNYYTNHCEYNK